VSAGSIPSPVAVTAMVVTETLELVTLAATDGGRGHVHFMPKADTVPRMAVAAPAPAVAAPARPQLPVHEGRGVGYQQSP